MKGRQTEMPNCIASSYCSIAQRDKLRKKSPEGTKKIRDEEGLY